MNRERAVQIAYLLLRLVAGLMFFQAGAMKLFGWFGGMPPGTQMTTQTWIGGVLEAFGGIAIMLGLFTRPIAFLLSGEMAVAYFQFHQPNGTWPIQNGGQPAVLYCFIFLFIAAYGGSEYSLDRMLFGRKKETVESAV